LENEIQHYFKGKKEIASVYLFGSFASGKYTKTSDIDIGILFEHKAIESAESLKEKYMSELGRILRKDIDVIVMNTAGEVILNQIYKKGKSILKKKQLIKKKFQAECFLTSGKFGGVRLV